MDSINLAMVRQSFANAVFTHQVQEMAAVRQNGYAFWVKVSNIILVSVVLVLLFLQLSFPTLIFLSFIGTGVTIAEVIFLIIQLTFSFEQQTAMHKSSALKYMGLRDCYRLLIADIMNESISSEAIETRRDLLQNEYQVISDLAPQTGPNEYDAAQRKLNSRGVVKGEQFTWSDEEIDRFLPEGLRISSRNKG